MGARRSWQVVLAGLLGALAVALLLFSLQSPGTPSASSSSQSATASPDLDPSASSEPSASSPPAAPTAEGSGPQPELDRDEAIAGATAAVTGFLKESQKLLADPGVPYPELERFASGAALEEVQAQAGEFVDLESRVTGGSRVVSMTAATVEVEAVPARVTLSACLDDSGVVLLSPENPEGVSTGARVLNIYAVEFSSGAWRVVEHSYPDRTDC